MFGHIYCIRNRLNGKGYVGKTTKSVDERWCGHTYDARRGSQTLLHKAIRKHGDDAFEVEVLYTLEHCDDGLDDDELLNELERAFIVLEGTHVDYGGYNLQEGGTGGDHPTLHTLEHIKRCMVGVTPKEHARRSGKGKKRSLESRQRQSEAQLGRHVTDVTRKKLAEVRAKRIAQYSVEGELLRTFSSVSDAFRQTGISNTSRCASGRYKSAGGFIWRWIE